MYMRSLWLLPNIYISNMYTKTQLYGGGELSWIAAAGGCAFNLHLDGVEAVCSVSVRLSLFAAI
jgi:hypothetical protein